MEMTSRVTVGERLLKRAVVKRRGSDRCVFNREDEHQKELN